MSAKERGPLRGLRVAFAFLTRLPVPGAAAFDARDIGRAAPWFPVVGALLGSVLGGVGVWAVAGGAPGAVVATLLVGAMVWTTGAFHQDALADAFDGLGGGRDRADALRIMRDSTIGAYGAVAVVVALAVRITASSVLLESSGWAWFVVAPAVARGASMILGGVLPYARASQPGLGRALTDHVGINQLWATSLVTVAVALLVGWWMPAVLALAAVLTYRLGRTAHRRVGGVTGDILGAATELVEVGLLALGACVV